MAPADDRNEGHQDRLEGARMVMAAPDRRVGIASAFSAVLEALGENPAREGLANTPLRYAKALMEMTRGYDQDPAAILGVSFGLDDVPAPSYDGLVLLRDVPFVALCEHHVLPFDGVAHVAYLPGERVIGLSKLARLVDVFACRLTVQERLTAQVADALMQHSQARGAACVVEAVHSCMSCRGVRKTGATMVTSSVLGEFEVNATLRAEALALLTRGVR